MLMVEVDWLWIVGLHSQNLELVKLGQILLCQCIRISERPWCPSDVIEILPSGVEDCM
jgi:hypothetical protein